MRTMRLASLASLAMAAALVVAASAPARAESAPQSALDAKLDWHAGAAHRWVRQAPERDAQVRSPQSKAPVTRGSHALPPAGSRAASAS